MNAALHRFPLAAPAPDEAPDVAPDVASVADALRALMDARQTVLPKRLVNPGPDAEELHHWPASATSAPDHDRLRPWRLVPVAGARGTTPAPGSLPADRGSARRPVHRAQRGRLRTAL